MREDDDDVADGEPGETVPDKLANALEALRDLCVVDMMEQGDRARLQEHLTELAGSVATTRAKPGPAHWDNEDWQFAIMSLCDAVVTLAELCGKYRASTQDLS